jgi:hypothetical protein
LRNTSLDRGGDIADACQTMLKTMNRFLDQPNHFRDFSAIASDFDGPKLAG